MPLAWSDIERNLDKLGIPKFQPCAAGGREPSKIFFDCVAWKWMGVAKVADKPWLFEQLADGRWIGVRRITAEDRETLAGALAADLVVRTGAA